MAEEDRMMRRFEVTLIPVLGTALAATALTLAAMTPAHAEPFEPPPAATGGLGDLEVEFEPGAMPGPAMEGPEPTMMDPEQRREEVHASVRMRLDTSPEVDAARVLAHVSSLGVVRLTGVVADEAQRELAAGLVAVVPGVTDVENELRVEGEDG